jgi:hypothetical protein
MMKWFWLYLIIIGASAGGLALIQVRQNLNFELHAVLQACILM